MTTANAAERIAQALREGYANLDGRGLDRVNEAVTRSVLIDRVLEELGYPPTHRSPEDGDRGDRPDDLCYLQPVGRAPGPPALVLEAKKLDTDLDRAPSGAARAYSPDRQIQRYLENNRISGPGTLGVLTDGLQWRIYQRANNAAQDVQYSRNFDFSRLAFPSQAALDALAENDRQRLKEFIESLSRQAIAANTVPGRPEPMNLADGLFDAVADGEAGPERIVQEILGEPGAVILRRLENAESLTGVRLDAHKNDWESYALAQGNSLALEQPGLEGGHIVVAAVKFQHKPSREISRGDVALCARMMAASAPAANAAVVFAYDTAPNGAVSARMAAAVGRQVNMTAGFNPALPRPSARATIGQLLRLLRDAAEPLNADRLLSPLAAATLRQQFYREVAQWADRVWQGQDPAMRQAVLRHLIRVMFAWILKEENRIPPEIFELAFIDQRLARRDDYHRQALLFLFHHRLNVHPDRRDDCPIRGINAALEEAPFLNGSLFARHDGDDELELTAQHYWNIDRENPGLFTILSRYHWTMDEHRPGESEQTLDPELLSNLFERLIAPAQGGETLLKQPQGTYYTPADVADEMVKDALAAAVKDDAAPLTEAQLLQLFGDPDAPLPEMSPAGKERLIRRLRELRVFDPAVGSGEFLFSMLLALRRALKKLTGADEPAEEIIRRQLRGQDINPLAVQIARLRLFIAITAARPRQSQEPLPNLEAVIVCADTLQTVADPQWRAAQLDLADPETGAAVQAVAANRAQWFDAWDEEAKRERLNTDEERRANLKMLLQRQGDLASPELLEFAEAKLMADAPAKTDARLLFPQGGFDIVIGNPPYEALAKSMDAAARKRLTTDKNYQTVNAGDLYPLFCEAALAIAKPSGGVVTLIVPLSISFGQSQRKLREIFNARCREINLRHYDNIPDTIFNGSPTLKTWKNRQRTTIVVALLGDGAIAKRETPIIKSTGLQGWPVAERELCLAQRPKTILNPIAGNIDQRISQQWLRIATPEVAELITAILDQSRTVSSYRYVPDADDSPDGEFLSFPHTAYQFLGVIPANSVSPRRENLFRVKDKDDLRLLMATLNGHVGYAWWWTVGDGFDVKAIADLEILRIPNIYSKNPDDAIKMGQRLIDAIPECTTEKKNSGTVWRNVNFHLKPELIEELDRLHLAALGLAAEPLLGQLRMMRSSSSWNYGAA